MKTKEAHVGKMETRLQHWGEKLDKLLTKVKDVREEVENDYQLRLTDLRTKHGLVQAKLEQLRASGVDEWEQFKGDVETAWKDLVRAFKELKRDQLAAPITQRAGSR